MKLQDIKKEKIDTSSYFLQEARMIEYGGEKGMKESGWLFRWVHEGGAIGDYLEITVSMSGQVSRFPSM